MLISKNELKIVEIKVYVELEDKIKTGEVLVNAALGLFGIVGGEAPTNFNIALTDKNLYIEAVGLSEWGRLPESKYVETIPVEQIKLFNVTNDGNKELIEIKTTRHKSYNFIRNNFEGDNLAAQMAKNINNDYE